MANTEADTPETTTSTLKRLLSTRDVEIEWIDPVIPEIKEIIAPLVASHLWLAPRWCRKIFISTNGLSVDDSEDAPTRSEIYCEVAYGWARLTITPSFLHQTEQERERTIRHEICHLPLRPFHDFVENLVESLVGDDEDDPRNVALVKEMSARLEESVTDLEAAVSRYMEFNGDADKQ
jgi:hypothetical protein